MGFHPFSHDIRTAVNSNIKINFFYNFAQSKVDEPCNYRIYSNMFHNNGFYVCKNYYALRNIFCEAGMAVDSNCKVVVAYGEAWTTWQGF